MISESTASARRATTRQYLMALAVVAGGALLGWWASAATWMVVESSLLGAEDVQGVQAVARESVSGASYTPLAAAMPIVGLAGLAGIIGSRRWLRRVIGLIIAVAGLALTWSSVGAIGRLTVGAEGPDDGIIVSVSPGYALLAALAGAVLAGGGVWTVLRGATWPSLGVNYERAVDRPRNAWEALDRGIDPTDPETSDADKSDAETSDVESGDARRTERP